MLQVRQSCFETNSSSTHAICIPKGSSAPGNCVFTFRVDRFGWESDEGDACDYLYTALCERYGEDPDKLEEVLNHIREVAAKKHNECEFITPKWSKFSDGTRYLDFDEGYIDHCSELYPLIDELLNDDDLLMSYIGGASVFTGNDNSDDDRIDEIISDYESMGYYVYEKGN